MVFVMAALVGSAKSLMKVWSIFRKSMGRFFK